MFSSPRKAFVICVAALSCTFFSGKLGAQSPISPTTWGGTTPNAAAGPSAYTPLPASSSPGTARVNVSQWNRGAGISYNAGANRYNSTSWTVGASTAATVFANNDYIYFTVTNNSTTELRITGVNIGSGQASGTGPTTFGLMYRIGSASALVFGTNSGGPSPSFSMPSGVTLCAGETITFYLCGWGGSSAAGTWSINSNAAITAQWANAITTTASNSSPVIAGTPFTLTGTPSGGVTTYTYSWTGPLSYSSAAASPSVTPASTAASGVYTLQVTDAWGCNATATTNVTVNPAIACSGTPVAGTTAVAPASHCGSGISALSLSGSTTASGLTYQWLSSATPGGPYTVIGSATSPSYSTPTLATTTYYRCIVTCTPTGSFDTSSETAVTINPLPTISASGGDVCSGGTGRTITASGASTYSWAPSTGLSAVTGATVTANPTTDVVYTVTGTDAAGCVNTNTVAINYVITPGAVGVLPTSVIACAGDAAQLLTATGGTVGPTTITSGSVTIPASISAFGTITTNLTMAGIPAGAIITGASVNVISFGSQFQDDYVFNIKAPNGSILNLINQRGSHTSTVTTLFANTNLSSAGVASLGSGSGTFTGTWNADAINAVGGTPYTSNTTTWSSLFSIPNGIWTLSIYNNTAFVNTVVSSMQWSITLTYSYQSPITWSPLTDLYTDAAATTPYTGGTAASVYFSPATAAAIAYVATASNSTCTRTVTVNTTVNALPAITGADTVCIGQTVTLTGTPAGGTWISSNANVSVSASDITGVTAGTSEITYTLPTGCFTTYIMTVNSLPLPITGPTQFCEGASVLLSTTSTGGAWSSSNSNASADAVGNITGSAAGTSTISYTLTTGCSTTHDVTINQAPAAIGGPSDVCIGSSITLTNGVAGGTWSSDNGNVIVDASLGTITGATAGTSVISYMLLTGCYVTQIVTINALPNVITGPSTVCENGGIIDLDNATTGGSWGSSNSNVNVDITTGIVTGALAGNTVITYTATTGCYTTKPLTVNIAPATISGPTNVCQGSSVTLTNTTGTGTWTTASSNITLDASTGLVNGINTGTATISYTIPSGCFVTTVMTIDQTPSVITGLAAVCLGATIPLASTPSGGTWTADNTNVFVNTSTGEVTGINPGTSVITYTIGTGCYRTRTISINSLPDVISGPTVLCAGSSVTLTNSISGGSWISDNASIAGINNTSGLLNGASAGTATISYVLLSTGCSTSAIITVDALPATPTGSLSICYGATVTFSSTTPGGSWSSSNSVVASVDAMGNVHGSSFGTARISYTSLTTGCSSYAAVTVTATPSAILGGLQTCISSSTPLSNPMTGGTWSSGNPAVGTINTTSGVFTGITPGTATVTYGLLTGCSISTTVTVNTPPPAITGPSAVCVSAPIMLFNSTIGGTWSTGNPAIASVASSTGVVAGVSAGMAPISYTTGIGCTVVKMVSVHPLPAPITGPFTVCQNGTINLASSSLGGTWASSDIAVALIGSVSGVVSGISSGITYITYRLPTSCATHATITVNASPAAITGSSNICIGASSALSSATPAGTWSSSNTSTATISGLGVAFGNAIGAVNISYTLPNGCYTTTTATVQPLPALFSVTGGGNYCAGGIGVNIGLSASQSGVNYTLYSGTSSAAVVPGTGSAVGFGLITSAGVYTAQAINTVTGCQRNMSGSAVVSIQPLVTPAVSISSSTITDTSCSGSSVTFNPIPVNGGTLPVYTWLVNGAVSGTGATYSYSPVDGDVVSVKMASNIACRSIDTVIAANTRTVLAAHAPAVAFSVFPNDTVCQMTPVTFTASPSFGGAAPTFVWTRNGTPVGTGFNYTYNPANHDVIKCIITSNYRCRISDTAHSANMAMSVQSSTLPMVGITVAPGTTIAVGQTCTFTAAASNAGPSPLYQWSVNGTAVSGAISAVFVSSSLNNGDVVTCLVTSSGICSGITNFNSVVMTVLQPGGIEQYTPSLVNLIPNPNTGTFTITGLQEAWLSKEVTVTVTNTIGQKVHEETKQIADGTIDTKTNGTLPDGVYIATLKTANQRISIRFVIKR